MPKRNLAWIVVIGLVALLFWRMPRTIAGRDALYTAFAPLVDARAQILKRSAEPVDDSRMAAAATRAGIEAMVRELHDPYALYLDAETYPEFKKQTEGVFGGVGVDLSAGRDGLVILGCVRDSPADRAGLRPGETLLAIDDLRTVDLGLVDGINRLAGPPGTPVRLLVRRADATVQSLRLTRALIEIDPIRGWARRGRSGWHFWLDERRGIAYVRVVKFMPQTLRRLDAIVEPLSERGLRSLVLDLRENTGGLLRSAIDVADRFLDAGPIVATRGPRTEPREWFAQREDTYRPPPRLVVLVNRNTASAAEIVAGALQDHRRAVVVGERSYGKGSLQELIPLEDEQSAIKLTTGYYYLPSGRCLQRRPDAKDGWGVAPDQPVPLSDEQRRAWFAAWSSGGAESAGAATQPADTAEAEPSAAAALEALLAADPQLARALELLVRPPATRPASAPATGAVD
ncbi:MAG: S41 family peptidase [Phycisphaerae bacterium]